MILAELRQYLSQHKRVALVDLSCHFEIEAEARHAKYAGTQRLCNQAAGRNRLWQWLQQIRFSQRGNLPVG
jgi:hypothetical protein